MKYYFSNKIGFHTGKGCSNFTSKFKAMKNVFSFRTLITGTVFGLLFAQTQAQTTPQYIADSLQEILDASLPTDFAKSGAVMTVYVPGQWTWSSASGYAISGITGGQPQSYAQATDKFRTGSITKMMIATCILKLQEDGLLHIEDPIDNYLRSTLINDTIQPSETIRIRHLLNHTSGISNSADNTSCQMDVLNNPAGAHSLEDAVYCGASQGEIFPPEFAWAYSNTNYSLLAMIINEVSGMDYRDYLNQTIIQPLNLTQTEIPATLQIQGNHMGCYWNIGSWTDLTIINSTTYAGWADVVSTTTDLVTFYEGLRNGNIINASSFALMQTMYPGTFDYGLGYDVYDRDGIAYTGHYGEVANTSGLFFANTSSTLAPYGYYIAYNFNTQGADMINLIDEPVLNLLNGNGTTATIAEIGGNGFEIYPNPAADFVRIFAKGEEIRKVTMFDETGNLVQQEIPESGTAEVYVDCSKLRRGIYIIQVQTDGKFELHKIVLS